MPPKPLLAATVLAMVLLAAACGSKHQSSVSGPTTSAVTTTQAPATTTTVPTTSTTKATTTTAPSRGGGATVPAGFDPVSFTAISADQFWLLGAAPCANPVCTSIVRTTDGGTHFTSAPAPASALDVGDAATGGQVSGEINTLRFADPEDGYAFDSNPGGAFWVTHDGGRHWAQPSFASTHDVLGFGTGGGYAFALVGSCSNGTCSDVSLERSPVGSEQWADLAVPVPSSGVDDLATMTVHGTNLWFSLTVSANASQQLLVEGTGSGASFNTYQSPCSPGLGGTIQATSDDVVWAVCPSGMMAEAFRSSDGGASWEQLSSAGQLVNSSVLGAASDTTALIAPSSQAPLMRTTDGGATWPNVNPSGTGSAWWSWIGFTDAGTGSALLVETNMPAGWPWPHGPSPEQLWRTSDGGATWSGPVKIS